MRSVCIKMLKSINFTSIQYEHEICIARTQRIEWNKLTILGSVRSFAYWKARVRCIFFFQHSPEGFPHDEPSNLSCIQMSNFVKGTVTHNDTSESNGSNERESEKKIELVQRARTPQEKLAIISKVFPAMNADSQLIICFPFSLVSFLHRH